MQTCSLCGQSLTPQCCEDLEAQRLSYREAQKRRAALFDSFGIDRDSNPSHTFKGEWEIVPRLPSLIDFLARQPLPADEDSTLLRELAGNPLG